MLIGAVLWGFSGADLDLALDRAALPDYLMAADGSRGLLIANLSVWITGVLLLGVAANMMAGISIERPVAARMATYNYAVAIPLVIAAYVAWLAVVVQLSPDRSPVAATVAATLGWFASRADWIATILVLATGPALLVWAGRGSWAPRWLERWSYVALFAGLLNLIAMFAGGLTSYGFLIIPVGMGWMFAAAWVLHRRRLQEGMPVTEGRATYLARS